MELALIIGFTISSLLVVGLCVIICVMAHKYAKRSDYALAQLVSFGDTAMSYLVCKSASDKVAADSLKQDLKVDGFMALNTTPKAEQEIVEKIVKTEDGREITIGNTWEIM